MYTHLYRGWSIAALLLVSVALVSLDAMAQNSRYFSRDGVAIEGYDAVAYFVQSEAVLGSSEYSHEWMGSTWHFASAENRDTFAANPESYAPQYGGYCAWAAANNYIFEIDPHAFTIHRDKLYLNAGFGTRVRWSLDKDGNISRGDNNWPGLLQRLQ